MKLSKFVSIVFLTAIVTTVVGGFFVMSVLAASAQEIEEPLVDEPVAVVEVDPEDVPEEGSWTDMFQRARERFQLFITTNEEKKLALEEQFAAKYEAQLAKLEALPDDNPKKAARIEKLTQRHEQVLTRIAAHAERLTERKEEILEKFDELEARFEARKEWVEEKKTQREENREEWKERLEEKREEFKALRSTVSGEIKEERAEAKEKMLEVKKSNYQKTQELIQKKAQAQIEAEKKAAERQQQKEEALRERKEQEEEKNREIKAQETFKDRVEGDTPLLSPAEVGAVQGVIDYQPQTFFEKLGYYLEW